MRATDLNQALNYVDDAYLLEADIPDKEIKTMKNKKRTFRILAAAAMISLLSVTAYAAEVLHIRSLESGRSEHFETYSDMDRAIAKAGLQTTIPDKFENGFRFQGGEVQEVEAKDDNGDLVLTYQELCIYYENEDGKKIIFCAGENLEELPKRDDVPDESRSVREVPVNYYLDHYKFVPEDYKLSEAEEAWAQQPGNYVSYGSDEVEEQEVAFLTWTENGMYYFFMDTNPGDPEILFAMAEEVICQQ